MELFIIVCTLLFTLPITFSFFLKASVYCIGIYLKRKHSIVFSVAKCGLTSFRTIVIEIPSSVIRKSKPSEYRPDAETDNENPSSNLIIVIEQLRLSSFYLDNSCSAPLNIHLNNVTIQSPIREGKSPPIKIGSLIFPINKIRSDFIKHQKENFNLILTDIVVTHEHLNYHIEKLNIVRIVSPSSKDLKVEFSRVIFGYLNLPDVQQTHNVSQDELIKQRVLYIEQLIVVHQIKSFSKNLDVSLKGDCSVQWNLEFHINLIELINYVRNFFPKSVNDVDDLDVACESQDSNLEFNATCDKTYDSASATINQPSSLSSRLRLEGRLRIGAFIGDDKTVCIDTCSFEASGQFPGIKTITSDLICLNFDDHKISNLNTVKITYYPNPEACVLDRNQNSCGMRLKDKSNSLLCVDVNNVEFQFPYGYDISDSFNERFMGTVKWLKKYHARVKTKTPGSGKIDFDISLRVNTFNLEMEDDPFEVKLRKNYMLLEDEYHEQLKRDQTLQDKLNELKRTNLMLAGSIVDELIRALAKKNSEIYIQRSRQLYASESRQVPLLSVVIEDADLKLLADSSYHTHADLKDLIKTLNPDGPLTEDISFTTLFARIVSANFKTAEITLRDFPIPMLSTKDLTIKGLVVGTEQVAVSRARRSCQVYVGRYSDTFQVERSMTPLKFFNNLQLRCTSVNYTHGPCWEPVLQQVSLSFENIVSASSDPSPSLPWWDKIRFLLHGRAKLNCNQLSILLHASNDPYNQTEMIELTSTRSTVDWIGDSIKMKGDFDALLHTASKYDECRFVHIPNLDITTNFQWNCLGSPNDHYSIMPCAPDKVPDYSSHHSHDSYRSFRSQSLNFALIMETQFMSPTSSMNPDNMPSVLFFGSTIRWLENQKFIFVGPSKLTRRGILFNNQRIKKPSFSRIFKEIKVSMGLEQFQILYWSSVSKRNGLQMISGQLRHSSDHSMELVTNTSDGLIHRPRADWQTIHMKTTLANVHLWLYNLSSEDFDEFNEFNVQSNLKNRQYFMSLSSISYHKEAQVDRNNELMEEFELASDNPVANETQSNSNISANNNNNNTSTSANTEDHVPNHKLVINDLKAAWTKENRDVVISIYDSFCNSQQLKRNLSTEALKPIRIDPTSQPGHHSHPISASSPPYRHQRHPSTASLISFNLTPTPVSSVSKNRAVSMLQKLIADSENNPIVYSEDTHSGVPTETRLYGVEACQMDDVVDVNCLVELVNSQVVLCGAETSGYVIVSAANTEVRQTSHHPVWKNRTLLSKRTWTGSLKSMEYYATVDSGQSSTLSGAQRPVFANESDIQWLDPGKIESHEENENKDMTDPNMVGSGHSVGGVVSSIVGKKSDSILSSSSSADTDSDSLQPVQLQRIISRCNCLFYYASHTAGVSDEMQHLIPPLPDDDMFIEPWDKEVGVDSFTLTHQDLNVSTNSQQYAMILDIINNMLLFVEPHKKTAFEKLERMRFRFQLGADEDQRVPISQLQDKVRNLVSYLKRLERERYLVYRASIDDSMTRDSAEHDYRLSLDNLSYEVMNAKEQLQAASEELSMMIICYKELQLGAHKAQKQQAASQQGVGAFFANVIKRNEICFKSAHWRVTDSDGQLGLADIVLNNFLYSKVVKSDDSVEHTIELGHLHVSNLIPNQAYKDVLHPTELQANIPLDRQRALRVYCRELAAVGGIPVKEHLEVNVVPFTVCVTLQFFQKMVKFFFAEKEDQKLVKESRRKTKDKSSSKDSDSINSSRVNSEDTSSNTGTVAVTTNSSQRRGEEIEKMRERAAKNHTFVYVKIPGIPIKVSYKGKKLTDLKNISLTLPTLEYHNSTWTWLDLLMAVKNDSRHTVIKQALTQKMKVLLRAKRWKKVLPNVGLEPTTSRL